MDEEPGEKKRGRGRPRKYTFPEMQAQRKALYHPKKIPGGWMVGKKKLPPTNRLTALLFAFRHAETNDAKEYLFWEVADHLWNKGDDITEHKFARHKWSVKIIRECIENSYLAIGGAANVGKSYVCAGWGIINWMCDPANTIVLMTSTDREGAKKRIWGAMQKLLEFVPDAPCKNQYSIGSVAYWDGAGKPSSTAGLFLVTADKSKSRDKVGKLIGIHAPRVILIADELSDISENVQSAATGNLSKNPFFQMIGLSNPSSKFDPFGIFATPKKGWESINPELDYEWATSVGGRYIRIDCELSPNFDFESNPDYPTGVELPYLPTEESIAKDLATFGSDPEEAKKSREWLRFSRAIFFDQDGQDSVYTELEFVRSGATSDSPNKPEYLHQAVLMAGFDPAFSSNGDKSVFTLVEVGFDRKGQHCVMHKHLEYVYIDAFNKVDPPMLQLAIKVRALCEKYEVEVTNLAVDASGAGVGFCDMLALTWKSGFMRVQFGGAASDRKIKNDSKVTAKERYGNRATELFFNAKLLLLGRQIYGVPPVVIKQMVNRGYSATKGTAGIKLTIEKKVEYKARTKASPDEADSFMIAVEGARIQQMLMPADPIAAEPASLDTWLNNRRTLASYSDDRMGFCANIF